MSFCKVLCLVAVVLGCANATGYGAGAGAGFRGVGSYGSGSVGVPAVRPSYGGGASGAYNPGQSYPPQPYNFDYTAQDEQGNSHYRQEQGDSSGAVRGSYGYTDNQGLYRVVEYVADAGGFRANVRTNEPGTGKEGPADVAWTAVEPPAGIYDRYTRGGYGGGAYRAGAGASSVSHGVVAGAYGGGFGRGGVGAGFKSGKSGY